MGLPLPVPSPWIGVVMVLGTGASFVEGFVLFAEASISAGTRSGGSCSTNCGDLHPPARVCQSRTRVGGFLGGAVGGPSPRVCCWSPTDKSGVLEWSNISVASKTGLGSASGSSVTISSGGAMGVASKWLNM